MNNKVSLKKVGRWKLKSVKMSENKSQWREIKNMKLIFNRLIKGINFQKE